MAPTGRKNFMATKMTEYMVREVNVEMSLLLPGECSVRLKVDVDSDDVMLHIRRALETAGGSFMELLKNVQLPENPLAGDEPLVQVQVDYFEVKDGDPETNFTLSTCMTETAEVGKVNAAVFKASADAFSFFNRRIGALTRCVIEN